ncbi:RNA12 protein-domain-containing protein [Gamsiella multidivaricata]|uniref:RNA12 protein-domain-containing protein n=1 Tax=Gamsiella multidivaricata TaxID=101098 RepID=UPI00221F66E3|nr:RNA12 protein-domain-containing protein [Gamsiella multidivaricata]KAG0366425.1 mitochondrial escape protein 2 [Gamsiella multidivaricata]KAI7821586.1 RNA12 protein-domain-containing protein [Gamsiella multidivaricata]
MYRVAASSEATLRRFYTPGSSARHNFSSSPLTSTYTRCFSATTVPATPRGIRSALAIPRSYRSSNPTLVTQPNPFARTKKVPNTSLRRGFTTETEAAAAEEELPLKYGLLYFDNAYPLKMGWWDVRYSLLRPGWRSLERKAKKELVPPENGMPFHFKVGGIEPRLKDGGMFLHFSYVHPSSYTTKEALKEIESRCEQHLLGHGHYMWFNLQKVRAFLVKGTPFLEDLSSRYPNKKIRIEYSGGLGIEGLYELFRKYGKIVDIVQVAPVKDMPQQAIVQYQFMRSSTSAKNCLHGTEVNGVKIHVTYERTLKGNVIWTWLSNHPRISVPLGGFMVAGVSLIIFDPIRVFSMHAKIIQLFNVNEYPILKWLRKETIGRLTRAPVDSLQATGWREREEEEEKLRVWLRNPPETFAIVQGPRGAGKTDMVEYAIKEKKHRVVLRCEELANARSEGEVLTNLAKQVGYVPLFQFMNTFNNMMDMAIAATTGQKAGLSATFEGQLKKILDTLTVAIQQASPTRNMSNVSPESIMKKIEVTLEEKAHRAEVTSTSEGTMPTQNIGPRRAARAKAKAKKDAEKEESKWCDPDDIPVILIDGYMSREKGQHTKELWTFLAEWAAVLVENHVAHVIFISNNVAAAKPLSKALPNMTFETIVLSDASLDSAMEFVYKHLDKEEYPNLKKSVEVIGGRLTDLELFVQKVKSGMSPEDSVRDILGRAIIEVRKNAFDFDSTDNKTLSWTPIQFWAIMKQLAVSDSISYDELKIDPLSKGDEAPFAGMEQAELITISHKNGRPYAVKPGKPIYRAAFQQILLDEGFAAVMNLESTAFLEKLENANVVKLEGELKELSNLLYRDGSWLFGGGRIPKEIDTRAKWLMKKLADSHAKIEQYEQEMGQSKKVVAAQDVHTSN